MNGVRRLFHAMLIKAIWTALERFYEQDSELFKGKHVKEEERVDGDVGAKRNKKRHKT